jgi:hypothetical protein
MITFLTEIKIMPYTCLKVDLRAASLNTNDVFLLKNGGRSYVWSGKGSTGDEREMAKKIAAVIARGEQEVVYEGMSTIISGSHGVKYEDDCLLGCCTV